MVHTALTAMIVALLSSVVYKDVKESSCAMGARDAACRRPSTAL